ncbi:Iron-sulfur cluster assembly 1 [Phytophthora nicotianae]|uniref:Iron-sulfur cluster assembly 1 n=2 Tax=Phytophthora nicotianae TaxID=4792 RepID=A0A0W8DIH7_PHYNI|nr:Iron-sulfur cluster assembly 1 [Phytophthora nicotianae]KUF96193.1 Iron-sulfur cluster assembly 1 [Phytophthora nicotianae]
MTPFFRSVSRSRAAHASRLLSTVAEHAAPPTRRRLRELPPPLNLVRRKRRIERFERFENTGITIIIRLVQTDAAAERIKELLANKPDAIGIRLGVKTRTKCNGRERCGGCNGLSYTMNYADKKEKMEEEVTKNGVRVFVEPKALFHVVGTTMDFQITPVSSEFVFENPNAKGSCGCGESFNV